MRPFFVALLITFFGANAAADIYGSRASFLLMDSAGMSLSYLSSNVNDSWRRRMENELLANGDTHIYLYTQNEADDVGNVSPKPNWEARLRHLNSRGLRPIMWLMADDSPSLASKPLSYHKAHNAEMVRRLDGQVDGYVIGLEADEYWSAAQVREMVADLKAKTDKPVGVHLTPGVKPGYFDNADIIYLQTGFRLSEAQFRARVREALALGKPVIVSEYHLDSSSTTAKRFGDIACEMGAIGTGNGRNVVPCGTSPTVAKKQKWYRKYETEMVVAGVAMATLYAVTRYDLPLTLKATEDSYEIGTKKQIGNHSVGASYSENRAMATYEFRF